ncbi:MAG: hypothetical protein GX286_05620 [Clostridiales bacterium]|nr:hypothetical protein [Clostridiales bacterium]
MKRIFALMLVVISILTLSACGKVGKVKKEIKPKLDSSFSCNVKMKYGDLLSEAEVKRFGNGAWEAYFSQPNTLAGVKLMFMDDEVTASYKGLSFSVPKSALPIKSMMSNLFSIIDETAAKDTIEVINDKEYMVIEGRTEQGDYEIKLDKETGLLNSFEMPNLDLVIEFSDFAFGGIGTDITGSDITSEISDEETSMGETDMMETTDGMETIAETDEKVTTAQ